MAKAKKSDKNQPSVMASGKGQASNSSSRRSSSAASAAAMAAPTTTLPKAWLAQLCADAGLQTCSEETEDKLGALLLGFLQQLLDKACIIGGGGAERVCVSDVAAALEAMHRLEAAELRWVPRLLVSKTFKSFARKFTRAELVELCEDNLLDLAHPSPPMSDVDEQLDGLACSAELDCLDSEEENNDNDDAKEKIYVRRLDTVPSEEAVEDEVEEEVVEEVGEGPVGAWTRARARARVPAQASALSPTPNTPDDENTDDDDVDEEDDDVVATDALVQQYKREYRAARLARCARRAGFNDGDDDDDDDDDDDNDDEFGAAEARAVVLEVLKGTEWSGKTFTEAAYAGIARVLPLYAHARLLSPEPQSVRMHHFANLAGAHEAAEAAWDASRHNLLVAKEEHASLVASRVAKLRRDLAAAGVLPAVVTKNLHGMCNILGFAFDVPERLGDCAPGSHLEPRTSLESVAEASPTAAEPTPSRREACRRLKLNNDGAPSRCTVHK